MAPRVETAMYTSNLQRVRRGKPKNFPGSTEGRRDGPGTREPGTDEIVKSIYEQSPIVP